MRSATLFVKPNNVAKTDQNDRIRYDNESASKRLMFLHRPTIALASATGIPKIGPSGRQQQAKAV